MNCELDNETYCRLVVRPSKLSSNFLVLLLLISFLFRCDAIAFFRIAAIVWATTSVSYDCFDRYRMQSIFEEWVSKPIKYLQIHLFQVLNSGCNATITSPMRTNSQEKPVPSSDGTGAPISGIKSLGPSVRRREKSCQSESASSYAKNMSESSDSEARPVQDFNSTPRSPSLFKSKLGGKFCIHKRNSN